MKLLSMMSALILTTTLGAETMTYRLMFDDKTWKNDHAWDGRRDPATGHLYFASRHVIDPQNVSTFLTLQTMVRKNGDIPFSGYLTAEQWSPLNSAVERFGNGIVMLGDEMYAVSQRTDGTTRIGHYDTRQAPFSPITEWEYVPDVADVPQFVETHSDDRSSMDQITFVEDLGDRFHLLSFNADLSVRFDHTYAPDFLFRTALNTENRARMYQLADSTDLYLVSQELMGTTQRTGVIRLDASGMVVWTKYYDLELTVDDATVPWARVLPDNSLFVVQQQGSIDTSSRATIWLINPDGSVRWSTALDDVVIAESALQWPGTVYPYATSNLWLTGLTDAGDSNVFSASTIHGLKLTDGTIAVEKRFSNNHLGTAILALNAYDSLYLSRLEFTFNFDPFGLAFDVTLYQVDDNLNVLGTARLEDVDEAIFIRPVASTDGNILVPYEFTDRREVIEWTMTPSLVSLDTDCDLFLQEDNVLTDRQSAVSDPGITAIDASTVKAATNSTLMQESIAFTHVTTYFQEVECQDTLPPVELVPVGNDLLFIRFRGTGDGSCTLYTTTDLNQAPTTQTTFDADGTINLDCIEFNAENTRFWWIGN